MNTQNSVLQSLFRDPEHRSPRRLQGLTLIELLTTMSIVALLLLFAAPSFSQFIAANTVRLASIDLYTALMHARNEAIKRNVTVTLRPKAGGWGNGWEIVNPADATQLLNDHGAVRDLTIATSPDPLNSIQFSRSGRVSGAVVPSFSLSATGFSSLDKHCIQLDLGGRARVEKKPAC